ncbi:MAG: biotin--[acetyl-CoA-carboxylase] ligase [Syntrophorhabdaceae bacterium]|nr:biotin--[acetyl-CoA-carboxylase] ligase [Syntrophorhabdaceae bacterium]
MDRIGETLNLLRKKDDYVSGDYIGEILGVSRTAVWKYVKNLEKMGYHIDSIKGRGYRLINTPDRLLPWEIERFRDSTIIGSEIIHKDVVDSTNTYAFNLALSGKPEGTCVVAESQRAGKGRLNRIWLSPKGKNIYISIILRPSGHPSRIYPITFLSCLAVYDTIIEVAGKTPSLKWPNDVLMNGRKVCGTLLEISAETDAIRFVIAGIGFNVNMGLSDLGDDLKEKATSLFIETNRVFNRAYVCSILLRNIEKYYMIFRGAGGDEICRLWEIRANLMGKYIEVHQMGETLRGISEGIDSSGALLLNIDGKTKRIIAGDTAFN